MSTDRAVERLPTAVREAILEHEELDERNEETILPPDTGNFHEVLEAANEQYRPQPRRDAIGTEYGIWDGWGDAFTDSPAGERDDAHDGSNHCVSARKFHAQLSQSCGYGHPYMELDGALVVR
ncbi:hypothetical protein NDI76_21485 [Halogeometricum sp. S1BR25-6]|jgi:hypothetical protein|uniref:Uncharacterized protein n=1 Tax=Halogeometricum salsisoli TaxID=2950536 RepID=A0ABU2GKJ7_9EURY|nr:hypothetical protein [Halogeometricum sp. S1BR25-6]MDS0301310.1 hypothetical protein [Halogeometricum sp. S1BR25-6]